MSGDCLPIDATAGSPSFAAAVERCARSALMAPTNGRPLGARSGIRPGSTPAVTVNGFSYSVSPFNGVGDPGTAATTGAYLIAFRSTETGTINPANASSTRIDRLDVQVPDDPRGVQAPNAIIVYTPGNSSTGAVAPAPSRSFPLGTFSVPSASAGGNPSWIPGARYTVAAGGVLPVLSSADYPSAPYRGQVIDDPTLGMLRWNGSAWRVIGPGGDTGWTNIPLASGFTSSDAGQNGDAAAQVSLVNGFADLQGVVHGSFPQGTLVTIALSGAVPAGSRPYHKRNSTCWTSSGLGRLIVSSDGSIQVEAFTAAASYVDLSGCGYRAEI